MKAVVAAVGLLAVLSAGAEAVTGVWTGAGADGKWTNAANWQDGVIPGRYQGLGDWNGEAVFTACTGAATIDLAGLESIARITVRGADAPKFTFGTSASQKLPLEALTANVNAIVVESGVVKAPEFVARVEFGWHYDVVDTVNSVTRVRNDSTDTLKFHEIGDSGWTDKHSGQGGNAPGRTLYWQGSAPIEVSGAWNVANVYYTDSYTLYFDNPAGVVFTGTTTLGGQVRTSSGGNRIVIAEGAELTLRRTLTSVTSANNSSDRCRIYLDKGPFAFDGAGTLKIRSFEFSQCWDQVDFNCKVAYADVDAAHAETEGWTRYAWGSWTLSNYGNTIDGPLSWYNASVTERGDLRLPKFGKVGEASPLGNVSKIVVGNANRFSFIGTEADETDRPFEIGRVTWQGNTPANNKNDLCLNQDGSATLTVDSPLLLSSPSPADGLHKLVLGGSGSADGVWKHALDDGDGKKLQVTKTGTARWVLNGANTYTGRTVVETGTLALGADGSLAASEGVALGAGTTFEVLSGTKAVKALTATAGAGTLRVAAGATLDVGSFGETGGTLKVELDDGAVLTSAALKGQAAPAWISSRGVRLCFDADGRAFAGGGLTVTDEIPARGGVIPNDKPAAVVGVTSEGTTGPITIADGGDATIAALLQRTATEATVDLGGKTLTASGAFIEQRGTSLSFANGTLKAGADRLELSPVVPGSILSVAAGLDLGGGTLVKAGEGTVDLSGSLAGETAMDVKVGTVVRSAGTLTIGPKRVLVGTVPGETARLVITGATVGVSATPAPTPERTIGTSTVRLYPLAAAIILGHGGVGVLEIAKDAKVEASMTIGSYTGSEQGAGVLYVDGTLNAAKLPIPSGDSQTTTLNVPYYVDSEQTMSIGGYAYCRVEDGASFTDENANFWMAQQDHASVVFDQRGGTVSLKSMQMGRCPSGAAHYYMTGGTCSVAILSMPSQYFSARDTHTVLSLDGACEFLDSAGASVVNFCKGGNGNLVTVTNGTEAIINICEGGRFGAGGFDKFNTHVILPETVKSFVNIDGGTFYVNKTTDQLFGTVNDRDWRVDRVTVYEKGATIEVEKSKTAVANAPIEGLTGRGVASVVWAGTPAAARTYLGAPMVVIRDRAGKGRGATAAAIFDRATGTVTGIKVVTSGFDYEDPVAEIRYGVWKKNEPTTMWMTNACTLTASGRVSGGLTKTGEGTLVLAAACTYAGDTVLKEGTLTLSGADATLASSVVLAGGRLEVKDGAAMPNLKFSATGDPITYAGDLPDLPCTILVDVTGAPWKSRTLATFTGAFSADKATVQVVGAENPDDWSARFVTTTGGAKSLRLSAKRGTMLFVR